MKSIVVTGASTGIGWGCVKVLTGKGFHVFGSVRKQADSDRLQQEFGAAFTPLIFDVTDEAAVAAGARTVAEKLNGQPLFGLVNNAGIANPGPLLHLDIAAFRQQMEVNVTGQLIVTQAFAPLLGAAPGAKTKSPGRICMMSSVGGKVASPFLGPYSASKFALEGLSESLRRELMIYGVDVIIIAPGAIATPIWDKADAIDVSRYADTPYKPSLDLVKKYMVGLGQKGLPPERIGETVHTALTASAPKTRYIVTPEPLTNWLGNHLPKRMLDATIAKRLGLTRQS
ncbi:MAG TPA: SDR family NAD(P)-dependent oxidoreductase [Hyphomonadaceae bacterium]|jgi:NAD(P)-dependent dehydrogenase (short-subunit alcohol dehydrogenase family)|nr:SDR family NAD(P)-dependent oxidoreductase [Hyphomonadaceae bacterium]HPI48954.1 SDR family NAD(P)-dependent oxidoreductase [Hyphomonadaceae bacterium]